MQVNNCIFCLSTLQRHSNPLPSNTASSYTSPSEIRPVKWLNGKLICWRALSFYMNKGLAQVLGRNGVWIHASQGKMTGLQAAVRISSTEMISEMISFYKRARHHYRSPSSSMRTDGHWASPIGHNWGENSTWQRGKHWQLQRQERRKEEDWDRNKNASQNGKNKVKWAAWCWGVILVRWRKPIQPGLVTRMPFIKSLLHTENVRLVISMITARSSHAPGNFTGNFLLNLQVSYYPYPLLQIRKFRLGGVRGMS